MELKYKPQYLIGMLLLVVVVPDLAHGQGSRATLTVLGLNEDISQALVRYEDRDHGVLIQIREIQTDKVEKSWFADNRNDERKRVKRLTRKRFPVKAVAGQVDPSGRHTILGAPQGNRNYSIMVLRDGRLGVLGLIPLDPSAGDTFATAMLKDVVWGPNGKQVLVVVNQKSEQDSGKVDIDKLHWFRFRKWKVKWLKPSPSESTPDEPN